MKRFTVGITTHNEEETISKLLDQLLEFHRDEIDIIVFDDFSTDNTKTIIKSHPIAKNSNFHAYFSEINHKTPSVGRTYVGQRSNTEYCILVDGDDFIDVDQLRKFINEAPSSYDIIITPYLIRGKLARINVNGGNLEINSNSIMKVISAIAGKAYKTEILREFGEDKVKGRSDDARLNMRILMANKPRIFYIPDITFYIQISSRKSIRVSTINFDEIKDRVRNYKKIEDEYNVDRRYLAALKTNLLKIIEEDTTSSISERKRAETSIRDSINLKLKRIVFIGNNTVLAGGIPQRLRNVISKAVDKDVHYIGIMSDDTGGIENCYTAKDNEEQIIKMLSEWHRCDTVLIIANNLIRGFSSRIQEKFYKFPIIYMGSAQLAFFIQDSVQIADLEYVRKLRCSAIISLSDTDISFQRQLGIFGQVKGFNPVNIRESNSFDISKPKQLGYVGRLDFASKGCERLIDVARAAKEKGMLPIKLFTTRAKNSPDYDRFMEMVEEEQLVDQFDVTLECTDKDVIYEDITLLLLPSKKESFGNVVLEAFSYGIPVISTTYAPGPSEIIEHGKTGYLLDEFDGDEVISLALSTDGEMLADMSREAFETHKKYTLDAYLNFLEEIASDVLNKFGTRNQLPVFPELKISRLLDDTRKKLSLSREKLNGISTKSGAIGDKASKTLPRTAANSPAKTLKAAKRIHVEHRQLNELAREIAELERQIDARRRV